MSAFLRSIDLTTNLLAPIVTGQVMTYGSVTIGALFIAAWNLVFSGLEFALLYMVYKKVPELAIKDTDDHDQQKDTNEKSPLVGTKDDLQNYGTKQIPDEESLTDTKKQDESTNICMLFLDSFVILYRGWKTYVNQPIVNACLALAFLYMTVLGFDNITTGYAKQQGLSESLISILLATGALVGVFGTFVFPYMRKAVGLQRTGLISFTMEVVCLSLCVISVFVVGSPFDPFFLANGGPSSPKEPCTDIVNQGDGGNVTTQVPCEDVLPEPVSYTSIILLMTGIVSSRFGLWISDLTVTQLLLETPPEKERGIVNGVQNSLNKLMDILKSLLVLFLPWPQMFGYLIILSFFFVFIGAILFAVYSRKVRGHLFHFEQMYNENALQMQRTPSLVYLGKTW